MEDDIKIDLTETRFGCVDWIHMAHDSDLLWALVNMVIKILVP